jgi:hypothetical protein
MEQRRRGQKNPKRRRDLNQRAKRMVDIATGDLNQTAPAAKEYR